MHSCHPRVLCILANLVHGYGNETTYNSQANSTFIPHGIRLNDSMAQEHIIYELISNASMLPHWRRRTVSALHPFEASSIMTAKARQQSQVNKGKFR